MLYEYRLVTDGDTWEILDCCVIDTIRKINTMNFSL